MTSQRTKEVGVVVIVSLVALLLLVLLGTAVVDPSALSNLPLVTIILSLLWAAMASTSFMFLRDWQMGRYIIIGVALASTFLAGRFSIAGLVGGVLFSLLLLSAQYLVIRELKARIRFQPRIVLLRGIQGVLVGLAVAAFSLSIPTIQKSVAEGEIFVPREFAEVVLAPASPIIASIIPGYSPGRTVDELIAHQLRAQLQDAIAQQAISAQIPQARGEVSKTLGIDLNGSETVPEVVTQYVNSYLKQIAGGNGLVVIIILLVTGLFAVRAIVPLIAWPTLLVALAIVWVARKTSLIDVEGVTVTSEQLRIVG